VCCDLVGRRVWKRRRWWILLVVLRGWSDGLVRALQLQPDPILACYKRLKEANHSSVFLIVVVVRVSRPGGAKVVWRWVVEVGKLCLIAGGREDLAVGKWIVTEVRWFAMLVDVD
jgi:hypothetical protein